MLMVAVAAVAVCIGLELMRQRRSYYLQQAARYTRSETEDLARVKAELVNHALRPQRLHRMLESLARASEKLDPEITPEEEASLFEEFSDADLAHQEMVMASAKERLRRSRALKEKYERAAHRPWISVEPEPY